MYKKQHFFTITEISVRTLFFSHRTEIHRNYARFDEQIKKKFEKWFGLWQLFGPCHEPVGPLLGCFPSFSFLFLRFPRFHRVKPENLETGQKPPPDQKNQKNRKKSKIFPRPKNAQNSRQNRFAHLFGHRDLKCTRGCATTEKCPKNAVFDPQNRPFWTPDFGPRTLRDTQNRQNLNSRLDSW